jgi:hypothetical protein
MDHCTHLKMTKIIVILNIYINTEPEMSFTNIHIQLHNLCHTVSEMLEK